MKLSRLFVTLIVTVMITVSCFSIPAHAQSIVNNSSICVSNYGVIVEEYNKHKIGDIISFGDDLNFVIWSHEILESETEPNNYYIHTEYIEYIPNQIINYKAKNILSAISYSGSITPYFAATNTHTFSNTNNIFTATNLTRFMYDGSNYPSVYASEYRFSNSSYMSFSSWNLSKNPITKSVTQKLSYTYETYSALDGGYITHNSSVSVTCKKNGTQG